MATPIRLEAEHFNLEGSLFGLETNDVASGGALISLAGQAEGSRSQLQTILDDLDGTYDVYVGYYDESNGKGHIGLKLDGQKLDYWVLNKSPNNAPENNFYRRKLRYGSDITISPGQKLELTGVKKDAEDVRIDYIEFVPTGETANQVQPGELSLGKSSYSLYEGVSSSQQITVARSGGSDGIVSATLQLTADSATAADFATSEITVDFAAGETSKTITLPILDDAIAEGDESFSISLVNPTGGATLGSQTQATVTIQDNDIRLEAEHFNLEGSLFSLETNGLSSGGSIISLAGQAEGSRSKIQTILDDLDGTYDVYVGYYDDSGKGQIGVKLDGQKLDYWVLNKNPDDAPENNFYRRKLRYGSDITISPGQKLEITGVKKDAEDIRIDYIEFIPTGATEASPPPVQAGELAFGASNYSINEDGTATQEVTIIRTGGSDGAVSATIQLEAGTATPADYSAETLTVDFAAGETSKVISLPIVEDNLVEGEESFSFSLINPTGGATIGNQNQAEVTIIDSAQPGQLSFSAADYNLNEDGGNANQITILRSAGSDGAVSATVQLTAGTATSDDFSPASITVDFAADETSQTVTLPIVNDGLVEGPEDFSISLVNPTGGATIGSQNEAQVAIADDERPGELAFDAATYNLEEGGTDTNQVTLLRTGGSDGTVSATVQFNADTATAADYDAPPITVTFAPGETSKTFALPIVDDSEMEGEESFSLSLSNPTGGVTIGNQNQTTIAIVDNDTLPPPPPADVLVVIEAESFDLSGSDYVTTSLSGASGDSIISFDEDSSIGSGTVSTELNLNGIYDVVLGYYDPNDGDARMSITLGDDKLKFWVLNRNLPGSSPNSSNFIERQFSSASVITPGTRLEIFGREQDGDTAAVDYVKFVPVDLSTRPGRLEFSQASYSANENGATSATVTINRIAGTSGTVTTTLSLLDGTATAGNDFNGDPITVSFAPGEETKTVTIPLIDDAIAETTETLNLQLGETSGGATLGEITQAQFNIIDNEESLGTNLDISGNINASNPSDRHSFNLSQTSDFSAILEGLTADANLSLFDSTGALILSSSHGGGQTEQLSQTLPAGSYELLVDAGVSNASTNYDLIVSATADQAGQNRDLEVSAATYLGGDAQDEASAVEISPRNEIIVAGNFGTAQGTGQAFLGADSSSAGQIVRMSLSGREVLSVTHLGDDVNEIDVNRQTGAIAAVGDFGVSVLNETADQVLWSQNLGANVERVAIANDGTVVTLHDRTISVWNSDGTQRSQRSFTRTFVNDIAIDPDTNEIYATGFDNKYNNVDNNPVQVAYINSFDLDLNQGWQTWGFDADILTDDVNGQAQNDMADTRGYRITVGQDGQLYFLGEVAGGNSVYRWNGKDRSTPTQVKYDQYNDPYNSASPHQVYYARINADNGEVMQGQLAFPRLSSGAANTFRVTEGSLAADEQGNVYIGGRAFASIDQRANNKVAGQDVGSYAGGSIGEPTALVVSSDFQQRRLWTTFTENGGQGSIHGFAVGQGRAAILGTIVQGTTITSGESALNANAFNAGTDTVSDVYFATWATDSATNFASVEYGTDTADSLVGGSTSDLLIGGLGADTLQGDARLSGGGNTGGADTFAYNSPAEGGDTILDFGSNDQIRVSAAGFGLTAGSAVNLATSSQALGSQAGFIHSGGQLHFDADGAGAQQSSLLAALTGAPSLSASQIEVW